MLYGIRWEYVLEWFHWVGGAEGAVTIFGSNRFQNDSRVMVHQITVTTMHRSRYSTAIEFSVCVCSR